MPRRDQQFRDQPSLFEQPMSPIHVPADQGKQSRDETYREVRETHDRQRQTWLMRIIAAGRRGVTLDELSARHNVPASAFSGRVTELKDAGLVVRTGERRPTRAGKSAAVIVAKQFFIDNGGEPGSVVDRSADRISAPAAAPVASAPGRPAVTSDVMPDQLTNAGTVRDRRGRPLEAERWYRVSTPGSNGSVRVKVYEDEQGNLCCCRAGGDHGQRIDEMDPAVQWDRV